MNEHIQNYIDALPKPAQDFAHAIERGETPSGRLPSAYGDDHSAEAIRASLADIHKAFNGDNAGGRGKKQGTK